MIRLRLYLVAGLILLATAASAQDSVRFYLGEGARAVSQADWKKAIVAYENVIRFDSANFNALKGLGMAHLTLNERPEARAYFKKAHRIHSLDKDINVHLGIMYSEENNVVKAIDCFETALKLDSLNIANLNNLAGEYLKVKKAADARNLLVRAQQLEPGNMTTSYRFGTLYAMSKMYDSAEVYFQAAETAGYYDAGFLYYMGTVKRYLGKHDQAIEYYQKSLRADPNVADCRQALAMEYLFTKDYQSAQQQFQILVDKDRANYAALIGLGVTSHMNGETGNRDRILNELKAVNPAMSDQMLLMIEQESTRQDQ